MASTVYRYDAYDILGIERTMSSAEIAQLIDERIACHTWTNRGGREELMAIRHVLGDPRKRRCYDARLDSESDAELGMESFIYLANEHIGESKKPYALALVAVVTALVLTLGISLTAQFALTTEEELVYGPELGGDEHSRMVWDEEESL